MAHRWIGAVAQLGERRVRNAEVRGSTPLGSTSVLGKNRMGRGGSPQFRDPEMRTGDGRWGLLQPSPVVLLPATHNLMPAYSKGLQSSGHRTLGHTTQNLVCNDSLGTT